MIWQNRLAGRRVALRRPWRVGWLALRMGLT
jgi:hypothetical protein